MMANIKGVGHRGYITSREVEGCFVPQRVQNLVIRNYAIKKGLTYLLSATEYYMDNCFMILDGLMPELEALSGVIFYSTHLLPPKIEHRAKLYHTILEHQCSLHFALEELSIKSSDDIALIEDIILARTLSKRSSLEHLDY